VVDTVVQRYGLQLERVDAFEAADVVAVLVWERATLMMGVDAADRAEVVLCDFGVELVDLQCVLALDNFDSRQRDRRDYRAFSATDGTVTAPRVDYAMRKIEFENNRAAVTGESVFWQYGDPPTVLIMRVSRSVGF
jgi:hypothetical protein